VGEVFIPGLLFAFVLSVASLQAVNYERRLTISKNYYTMECGHNLTKYKTIDFKKGRTRRSRERWMTNEGE